MKVALVYDRVNKWGGAERVLLELHKLFPEAPLYTSVYDENKAAWASVFPKITPSFLQKIPFAKNNHEIFPWLTQMAFESFDFSSYNLVISLTSAEAKSIITKPETVHLCYCLTPTRYLWSNYFEYLRRPGFGILSGISKKLFALLAPSLRISDQSAARRPDYYAAISRVVQKRLAKYYRVDSTLIYPGVDTNFFVPGNKSKTKGKKFFLVVSRLVAAKRLDLVIEVFNNLGWELKIIGKGRDEKKLKKSAGVNIQFLGELTDKSVISYYQECEALIVSGEEDFGLTVLEVQSCGKPVIAFKKGGAIETVVDNTTGIFFSEQSVPALTKALKNFNPENFATKLCRSQAENYSSEKFRSKFKSEIEKIWKNRQGRINTQ